MKETAKPFKTHHAQLKLLRKRGLEVPTDGKPMRALERIGYYTLINGYKTLFLTRDANGNIIHLFFLLSFIFCIPNRFLKSFKIIVRYKNISGPHISFFLVIFSRSVQLTYMTKNNMRQLME